MEKRSELTKSQADWILRKMYKLLRDEDFKFSFDSSLLRRGLHAEIKYHAGPDGAISIVKMNPRRDLEGGVLAQAFHELLHDLYQGPETKAHERKIENLERQMLKLLSDKQLGNFLKTFARYFT